MDTILNPDPGEYPGISDMNYDSQSNRRPRETSDSEEDPHPKHPRKNETGRNSTDPNPTTTDNTPMHRQENQNVVLINLSDQSEASNFNNPIKLTNALNKSDFQKYIIEDSLRVLGTGKAIRFEVHDISKLRPLNQIKKLGDWEIKCKQPASSKNIGCSYGTIFPVEIDLTPEDITEKIRIIGGNNTEIIEVSRIKKSNRDKENENKWIPTKSLRLIFKGKLPEKVAIGHTSYSVHQYTFPIPKCFRCLMYGHGIMTCKNKQRCSKCSQFNHNFKDCPNKDYCFYCHGDHPPNTNSCRIHREAQNINTKNITPNDLEIKKKFQELKPLQKEETLNLRALAQNSTNIQNTNHSNTQQTKKYTNIQTTEHPNLQTTEHPNIQTTEHPNIQTTEHENMQTTELTTTQSYAQTLSQSQNITLGQRTPTNPKYDKIHKDQRGEATILRENSQKDELNIAKSIQKPLPKRIQDSPITWSLPTPLRDVTPTRIYKTQKDTQLNKDKDFSWMTTIKNIINVISNIIINMNSKKTMIEIITETINEVTPIIKEIMKYLNE